MDQRERGVAAENDAPLRSQAVAERLRQALHADDRRNPERDAHEKDAQTRKSSAQVSQREAGHRRPPSGLRGRHERVHADTRGAASNTPERMRTIRSQRAASAGS